METTKIYLINLLAESNSSNAGFKINLVKTYLQVLVLDFIYSHPQYAQLVFYGGSCLAHLYGLPRLSEDLDFVDLKKTVSLNDLASDLEKYFTEETDLSVETKVQKFRVYLKFPLLKDLGLWKQGESEKFFLKVEIFSGFTFCREFKIETLPFFKYNKSILVKTFDLSTLMATKIMAVFSRKWKKISKTGEILASVKGRDYFDLMWYLREGHKPNLACLEGSLDDLKKKLKDLISRVDEQSIAYDLDPLIDDREFVKNLAKDIKIILLREIEKL